MAAVPAKAAPAKTAAAPRVNDIPLAQQVFVGDLKKKATMADLKGAFTGVLDSSKVRKRNGRTSAYLVFDSEVSEAARCASVGPCARLHHPMREAFNR